LREALAKDLVISPEVRKMLARGPNLRRRASIEITKIWLAEQPEQCLLLLVETLNEFSWRRRQCALVGPAAS
jgi:hypothetical protein